MRIERKHWPYLALAIFFLAEITLPYIFANQMWREGFPFGGFLFNPIDGNSYLAKMRQGWNGSWQFTLPYTAEPGEGSYLFLFYLFLGHVARVTGLPMLFVYHFTRVVGAVALLWAVYQFCITYLEEGRWRLLAFALAIFGSGFGWIAVFFDVFTPDLWVPEAYPFLSAYATPHFAFGLALQITLLNPALYQNMNWRNGIFVGLLSLLLAIIMPFGAVVVGVMWVGILLWQLAARENTRDSFWRLVVIGLGSGPLSVYYLWIARVHPVLAGWNTQNVTLSPPIWELVIGLSPAFLLTLPGLWVAWKRGESKGRMLIVWFVLGLVLLYAPYNLQRRFISAFYVPVAILAVFGIVWLVEQRERLSRPLVAGMLAFSVVTNLIILISGLGGILSPINSPIYLWAEEREAYQWLEQNATKDSIVVALPQHGLRIPVYSDAKVIYGHPFETVNAFENEALVVAYLTGEISIEEVNATLDHSRVQYVLVNRAIRSMEEFILLDIQEDVAFSSGSVVIYELP